MHVIKHYILHHIASRHAGVCEKALLSRQPLPCDPSAETALHPPIRIPAPNPPRRGTKNTQATNQRAKEGT